MSIKASDYRRAGRYAMQDKRRREDAREIEAAETAVEQARAAYYADPTDEAQQAMKAAEDALYEIDPTNSLFS